jgi:hypothetical protein
MSISWTQTQPLHSGTILLCRYAKDAADHARRWYNNGGERLSVKKENRAPLLVLPDQCVAV